MIHTVVILALLVLIAMIAEPFSTRLKLPFTSLLVIIGFIGSEIIVYFGIDTGLRWDGFVSLILHLLVPIIIFESAFNLDFKDILADFLIILFLAIPAMLFASVIMGYMLFFGINDGVYFPIISALIAGTILSATDPVAVIAILKKLGAPKRLNILLEGESMLNDVTTIVVFTILIGIATSSVESTTISSAVLFFLKNLVGGITSGLVIAFFAKLIHAYCLNHFKHVLLSIITAIVSFYVAEELFHFSGVVAVLSAGLYLGSYYRSLESSNNESAQNFWGLSGYIANAILFILVGVTITVEMFTSLWLAILLGIFATIIVRALIIYGLLPAFTSLPKIDKVNSKHKNVVMWGGLRGAVSLALALSIPKEVEGWYIIQSIVYGVVMFTLFIQAPFIDKLVIKTLK